MADANNIGASGASAAEPQNTESGHMIPKARFDQVNEERKLYAQKLEALEAKQKADELARLEKQQEWQRIAEERAAEVAALTPYKAKAESAAEVMQKLLQSQLEQLPENARTMVETMPGDVEQKLDWLAANRASLTRPPAANLDAGARGDPPAPHAGPMDADEERAWRASGLTRDQWNQYRARTTQQVATPDVPQGAAALIDALRQRNTGA